MKSKWFCLFFCLVLLLSLSACGDDDDDDNNDDNDDNDTDDDTDDDDDDNDDNDTADDDVTPGPDPEVPRFWEVPCDIDGDGVGDYLIEDYYYDGGLSMVDLTIRNIDGDTVDALPPVELGTNGFALHQMSDIDGDGLCEIIAVHQRIDLSKNDMKVDGRVLVYEGENSTTVFDTEWQQDVYTFIQVYTDITGDGIADLIVNNRPEDAETSGRLAVFDATAEYQLEWLINSDPGEGFVLHGRYKDGIVMAACGQPGGEDAFLLERYDLYEEDTPQWRAEWIDRAGNVVGEFGPVELRQPGIKSAVVMHLNDTFWECAGVVAYPLGNLFGSRYVAFDRDGEELIDGELGDVISLYVNAAVSLDGNETPDLVLWGNQSDGAPLMWVAADVNDYEPTLIASGLPTGGYEALSWQFLPWLAGPVDITGARADTFAVVPSSSSITGNLSVPLYGTDLNATGFAYQMPLPTGDLTYASGYFLDIDGQQSPVMVVGVAAYESAPDFIYHSQWGVFTGDDTAPAHLEPVVDGPYVYLDTPWDFDYDDQPEICELYYPNYMNHTAGKVRLIEAASDYDAILTVEGDADHRINIVGRWK